LISHANSRFAQVGGGCRVSARAITARNTNTKDHVSSWSDRRLCTVNKGCERESVLCSIPRRQDDRTIPTFNVTTHSFSSKFCQDRVRLLRRVASSTANDSSFVDAENRHDNSAKFKDHCLQQSTKLNRDAILLMRTPMLRRKLQRLAQALEAATLQAEYKKQSLQLKGIRTCTRHFGTTKDSAPSTGVNPDKKDSTTSGKTSSTSTSAMLDQWLQGNEELNKKVPIDEEKNWEEADIKLRREQAIQEKKANELRAANVVRAIKGNIVICIAKFGAWASSGSSAMLSEFVHSLVDTLNQGLILIGLRDSDIAADRKHPYGYGKSLYFWSLISALGTFWMGAGIAGRHSIEQLLHPSLTEITWEIWSVLAFSFVIDGYVLTKTINDVRADQPKDVSFWNHTWNIRDPALMAILLEDGAACLGVLLAAGGLILTAATGMSVFDGLAGVGVSGLLAGMGLVLVRLNKEFLLGQAQDRKTIEGIQKILLEQESIEHVHSMQSQILGHGKFSFKAEVDFDGTYLAAKLMPRYQKEFTIVGENLDQELRVLLSWYAEDVMRTVEREVRRIEYEIRQVYPGAVFIELEPYSKDFYRYAVDDAIEGKLKRIEIEALNRYLKSLYMDSFEKLSKNAKIPQQENTGSRKTKDDNKSEPII